MHRRDEIPYLLDLHLFLSRPLALAPVRGIKEAAAAELDPGTSLLGAFPQVGLGCKGWWRMAGAPGRHSCSWPGSI